EEKIVLRASGQTVEQLLNCVGLTITADDTEIAMALLANVNLRFEYSELADRGFEAVNINVESRTINGIEKLKRIPKKRPQQLKPTDATLLFQTTM
ncbi:unnamed protein product, partial [Rotaria sp. Silwood1]